MSRVELNTPAPDFELADFTGKTVKLSDFRGTANVPDPAHTVLKLYGQEIKLFKLGRMPAQVLVDKAGAARFVHYGHDMTDIPKNEEILALLESLDVQTARTATDN